MSLGGGLCFILHTLCPLMSFAILERSKYPFQIAIKTNSKVPDDFNVWGEGFQHCKIHPFKKKKKSATEAVL